MKTIFRVILIILFINFIIGALGAIAFLIFEIITHQMSKEIQEEIENFSPIVIYISILIFFILETGLSILTFWGFKKLK